MVNDIDEIVDFIIELDKLKAVLRKTKPVGLNRYENSAEHSWQVCLLAQLLANYARDSVDIRRVIEILLVHDIPEIESGDQIVYQLPDQERKATEKQAAERIFGMLPETQAHWCMSRWQEYEDRQSKEAVFAYAIDRLMPVLHNIKNNGQSWRENRVSLERVLAVNAPIGEALPEVWRHAQTMIAQAGKAGVFEHEPTTAQQDTPPDARNDGARR